MARVSILDNLVTSTSLGIKKARLTPKMGLIPFVASKRRHKRRNLQLTILGDSSIEAFIGCIPPKTVLNHYTPSHRDRGTVFGRIPSDSALAHLNCRQLHVLFPPYLPAGVDAAHSRQALLLLELMSRHRWNQQGRTLPTTGRSR